MTEIDASFGEGGGQILRSALALSVITGEAMRLTNIRARRPQPGMKPQHLKAVEAAAQISTAHVEGATLGSQTLCFEPTGLQGGKYAFEIEGETDQPGRVRLQGMGAPTSRPPT